MLDIEPQFHIFEFKLFKNFLEAHIQRLKVYNSITVQNAFSNVHVMVTHFPNNLRKKIPLFFRTCHELWSKPLVELTQTLKKEKLNILLNILASAHVILKVKNVNNSLLNCIFTIVILKKVVKQKSS